MAAFLYERKCMAKLIFTSRYIRDAPPEHCLIPHLIDS